MIRFFAPFAVALVSAATLPQPAAAQQTPDTATTTAAPVQATAPVPAQAPASPHAQLYDTINASYDHDATVDGMLLSTRKAYAQIPMFAQLERKKPGFIAGMADVMRPFLSEYSLRVRAENRPAMIAIVENAMTNDEAASLVEFYQTPLARKVIMLSSQNYSADNVLSNLQGDTPATAAQVQADNDETVSRTLGALTQQELTEFGLRAMQQPAITKFHAAMPQMAQLRAEMEETEMTASEEARMTAAIEAYMERVLN